MKTKARFIQVILLLVAASIACSLPTMLAKPSETSTPTITLTPTATEPPEPPITSLMDNLNTRVASGEWTVEQGLVTTLNYVAGKASNDDINPQGKSITSYEGSPIVRAAMAYIQNGGDEATREQLQQTLDHLFPDTAKLELYSKPAQTSSITNGVQLVSYKSQDADCRTLWADGFPADSATTCFQYRSVTVGGKEYRLFIPTDLSPSDPRAGLADIIMDGIPTAVNKFLEFGDMPPADLVFTLFPDLDEHGVRTGADAATTTPTDGAHCQIGIMSLIGAYTDPRVIQQIIAHELFHCFQFKNYRAQTLVGGGVGDWWVEGTAEFFSNVAYPTVNEEYGFIPDFDTLSPNHSIVQIDYPDFVFFQYLEGQVGDEGVIQLISQMPTSGGQDEQVAALAAYPNIQELFHNFGRAYLDGKISDTGGGFLPLSPDLGTPVLLDRTAHVQRIIPDFVLNRRVVVFPADTVHTITDSPDSSIMDAVQPGGRGSSWVPFPSPLRGCSERRMVWLATRAESDNGTGTIDLSIDVQNQNVECDECLIGRWQLNADSYWNAVQTTIEAVNLPTQPQIHLTLNGIDGDVPVVEFTNNDMGVETFNNFHVNYSEERTNNGRTANATTDTIINGVSSFTWSTDSTTTPPTLNIEQTFSQPEFHNSATMTLSSGLTLNVPVDLPPMQVPVSGGYECSTNTLKLYSSANVLIQYDKISP